MRDISLSFAATAFIQTANIATGLLAARLLLPEGRGELAAIVLWAGLVAELGSLGLYDAMLYRAATGIAAARAVFAAMASYTALLTVVLGAIGAVVMAVVFTGDLAHLLTLALVYLVFYLPTYFAALFTATLFQGLLDLARWNVVRSLVPAAYLVGIGLAVAIDEASVAGFAAAFVAAHVISAAVGLWLAGQRGWIAWRADWAEMRALGLYGFKVHVGEILNTVRQRLDQALVSLWLPAADLGLYVVALTVANGPMILVHTVANVAFPKVSQQTTHDGKLVVFGRYFRFSLAVTAAVAAALFVLAHWLVPLLFGRAFTPAISIVYILLLSTPPFAAKLMFIQALKAWDRPLLISRGEFIGLIAAAAALAVLLPRYGLVGAAWSLVIANLAAALAMAWSLRQELRLGARTLLTPTAADLELAQGLLARLVGRAP